jgi:hypothetical protein
VSVAIGALLKHGGAGELMPRPPGNVPAIGVRHAVIPVERLVAVEAVAMPLPEHVVELSGSVQSAKSIETGVVIAL